ncbi:hypothetical protein J2X06_003386 [Lysobacter niastensis]|uniref:Uncharacterized protein n=1 Tax=Lysobacter niastensis TaxID=380629 RepID=A0ABU1WEY8_9GAMM|nr:hypothetical protein [Lysobacter niastensis]MDR7136168.1 hypothetical protein [Lysobacter niastensis]
MSEQELIALRTQLQQLTILAKQTDLELAKLQGHSAAVELVVAALVLTHPNPKLVRQAIAENRPELSNNLRDGMFAATLQKMEQAISNEINRREAAANPA